MSTKDERVDFSIVQKGQFVVLAPGDLIVQLYGVIISRDHCTEFVQGFLKGSLLWSDSFRNSVFPSLKILVPCTLGTEGHDLGNYFEVNFSQSKNSGGYAADQTWQDFFLSMQNGSVLVACMLFPDEDKETYPLLFAEIIKAAAIAHAENNPRVYFGYSAEAPLARELRSLIESIWKISWKSNISEIYSAHAFGYQMAGVFEQKILNQRLTT